MPEVSVIINCFNEAKYLRETLDSVFAQTFTDWEIIFWDNASSDGSGEIAAEYGEKVRCFRSDSMMPLGLARKLAYEETSGDFVAILDADDIWLPEKLERQMALFRSNVDLGMAYCDAIYFDEGGDHQRLFKTNKPHRGDVFGPLITKNFMFSSAMMFRRKALDKLGCAFDDKFARAQDYDLSIRMAYNYPVDYVDAALIKWRFFGVGDKPWKKNLIARVVEVKMAMDCLIEQYPDIPVKHETALRIFNKRMDYIAGITAWGDGKRSEARRHLSRHLADKKFALIYVMTFLSSRDLFYRFRIAIRDMTGGRV